MQILKRLEDDGAQQCRHRHRLCAMPSWKIMMLSVFITNEFSPFRF